MSREAPDAPRLENHRRASGGHQYATEVAVGGDQSEYRALLEEKLRPGRIRATLSFVGLFQMTHEMIKRAVVEEVRNFYMIGFDESGLLIDEEAYRAQVLCFDKRPFRASLLWLVDGQAITMDQADRLDEIYAHRHDLTHELAKYIVDIHFEPNMDLFGDALAILREIHRFWTQIEIDIGSFGDDGNVTVDDAVPGVLLMLQMCLDAYMDGITRDLESDGGLGDD